MKLLLVDNFDSFSQNVVHLMDAAGAAVTVVLNDDGRLLRVEFLSEFDAVLVGPGPGQPSETGNAAAVFEFALRRRMPFFGVCLGMQFIGECFGARTIHAPRLMHGKTSLITHEPSPLFDEIPRHFRAMRYHSLCVDEASLPAALRVSARSVDGVVQALEHENLAIYGVQFHPESIMTEHGLQLALNIVRLTRQAREPNGCSRDCDPQASLPRNAELRRVARRRPAERLHP